MLSKDFYKSAFHLFALCVLLFLCVFVSDIYFDTLVITKQGWIRGFKASDGNYVKYMGIPYATVTEDNPFGDSIPFPKLQGVYRANNDKIICPQIDMFSLKYVGTLNCLHINVYVPYTKELKPVMIFIHGGRFALGFTGTYDKIHFLGPRYFMNHGIILVTVSYRLGPYGFLCSDSPDASGNQGMKDVVKALIWVKENIEAFGGDSNRITVFGHSAGSMIIDFLLYTKAEKYIDQVILQSGTAHTADVIWNVNNSVPLMICTHLGFKTNDLNEALSFLKSRMTEDVIVAAKNLSIEFRPCIEKRFENLEGLIYEDPFVSEPSVKNKSIVIGHTTEEYNMKFDKKPIQFFKDNDIFYTMLEYEFDLNNEVGKEAASLVRHFYMGKNEVNEDLKWKIINFTSDITFNYPAHRDMKKFLQNGANEVYYYIFSYTSPSNLFKKLLNVSVGRSIHGDELAYLFETNALPPLSKRDRIILKRMTTMWTNFAKYGNPTPNKTEMCPVKWIPISKKNRNYLLIDLDEEMGDDLFKDRIDFWDKFYESNNQLMRPNKSLINLLL